MRNYDIIVWGSTGFTGKLTCQYLKQNYPSLKWAIAGRNAKALEEIKNSLGLNLSVDVLIGDLQDQNSINELAAKTKVILSTAGPYAKIGTPIVEACVEAGTHYCDITGEFPWVRDVIDKFHFKAAEKKLKIVNCCGYDSVPCDLSTQMVVDELQAKGAEVGEIRFTVVGSLGGASGGTISSALNIFFSSTFSKLLSFANPYYLNPRDEKTGVPITPPSDPALLKQAGDKNFFSFDSVLRSWSAPYFMQSIDIRLVNRSNALQGFRYGKNFLFTEGLKVPNIFAAMAVSIITPLVPLVALIAYLPFGRQVLDRILPSPGQGPSQHLLDHGFFKVKVWGKGIDKKTGAEVIVKGGITALHGDPGYRQTAKMIAEAALTLVQDEDKLPPVYGLVTPASALGPTLRNRLTAKGIEFYLD